MRELVIISGKGGTGKTSLTAAFAALAENAVLCDADVDAADLHLLMAPEVKKRTDFMGGSLAVIRQDDCVECAEVPTAILPTLLIIQLSGSTCNCINS